jgi:hypothetical protein
MLETGAFGVKLAPVPQVCPRAHPLEKEETPPNEKRSSKECWRNDPGYRTLSVILMLISLDYHKKQ